MADVEPTGPIGVSMDALAKLLAACPSWQSWCNAANATEAMDHIHFFDAPPPAGHDGYSKEELDDQRPMAVISLYVSEDVADNRNFGYAEVANATFIDFGRLTLSIFDTVGEEDHDSHRNAMMRTANRIGAVMADMQAHGGTQGEYLWVKKAFISHGPTRGKETKWQTHGDFIAVQISVIWGLDQNQW